MSQESDVCCTTSMYDIQNRCIQDEIDLFSFKTCIITHKYNVIEQNINVSMFDILSVKELHNSLLRFLLFVFPFVLFPQLENIAVIPAQLNPVLNHFEYLWEKKPPINSAVPKRKTDVVVNINIFTYCLLCRITY